MRLVFLMLVLAGAGVAEGSWGMWGGTPDHAFGEGDVSGTHVRVKWRYETDARPVSPPALDGRMLLVGFTDNTLRALDTETGRERWRFVADGDVERSPVVLGPGVVVGSQGGEVAYINRSDGAFVRWLDSSTQPRVSPAAEGPWLVEASTGGRISINHVDSLGRAGGRLIPPAGRAPLGTAIAASLTIASGVVYVPVRVSDGILPGVDRLYAFQLQPGSENGRELWNATVEMTNQFYMQTAPALGDGLVFVGGGSLVAFRQTDGAMAWVNHDLRRVEMLAYRNGTLFAAGDEVWAINASDGSLRWSRNLGAGVYGLATPQDDVLVVSEDNGVYGLLAASGAVVWEWYQGRAQTAVAVQGSTVFHGVFNEFVGSFGTVTALEVSHVPFPEPAFQAPGLDVWLTIFAIASIAVLLHTGRRRP